MLGGVYCLAQIVLVKFVHSSDIMNTCKRHALEKNRLLHSNSLPEIDVTDIILCGWCEIFSNCFLLWFIDVFVLGHRFHICIRIFFIDVILGNENRHLPACGGITFQRKL